MTFNLFHRVAVETEKRRREESLPTCIDVHVVRGNFPFAAFPVDERRDADDA